MLGLRRDPVIPANRTLQTGEGYLGGLKSGTYFFVRELHLAVELKDPEKRPYTAKGD